VPSGSAAAAAVPAVTALKVRITVATIRAIVFIFIKGLRSIGGGRG
jgi:hypothetical protein